MVASIGNHPGNRLGLQVWTIAVLFGFGQSAFGQPAWGQPIVPDASLGAESSRVETGPIDRISGGAQRGTSLFHSFAEFNVLAGQRVYFGNPIGVATIFSRVTGANASAIDGTLGVVGSANLFLLNPNGILFGPGAKLDIAGSFMASTASDWRFSNGTTFSAVTANAAPLLDVSLAPGLQLGQGPIAVNSALTVGQNLTLSADRLTLNGSLTSGGNLRLDGRRIIGLDPVIRSAGDVDLPFYEGNSLHIIAGGSVSIPDSVWIQGADPIGGLVETVVFDDGTTQAIDGRTIPTLDIRAGSLAGGASGASGTADIDLGTVVFAGADSDFAAGVINPIAGQLFLTNRYQANPLLDGDITIESPLGGLEGRAVINGDSVRGGDVFLSSRGAIVIDGDIDVEAQTNSLTNAIGNGGQIQMTAVGEIDLTEGTSLNASGLRGGTIALASADRIVLVGSTLDSQSFGSPIGPIQEGGTIVLVAPEIALDSTFVTTTTSGTITGGTIALLANNILLSNGSQIQASTIGPGQGGNVAIRATDTVLIDGVSDFQDSNGNDLIDLDSNGDPIGGLSSGIIVSTEAPPGANPLVAITGNAGALAIEADALIVSNGGVISSRSRSQGNGGAMSIEVGNLSLLDGGQILAPAYSSGAAGNIGIAASRGIRIAGRDDGFDDRVTQLKDAFKAAGLSPAEVKLRTESWVDPIVAQSGIIIDDINGLAKPGGLLLGSPSLKMGEGSLISSNSRGREDAGTIALSVQDLSLSAGAQIISSTFGSGKGGNVVILPQDETQPSSVTIDGVAEVNFAGINNILSRDVGGYSSGIIVNAEDGDEGPGVTTGTGGNLLISTTNLTLSNGGVLTARSQSGGNGGDMFINVDRAELSSGGQIVLSTFSSGNGGQVLLNANQTIVAEGIDETRTTREAELLAGFTAFFSAQIPALDAATIAQKAQEKTEFTLDTVSPASGIVANVEKGGSGTGGFIFATATDSIELKDSAEITASTFGSGDSGNILLQADRINFDNGDIRTIVEGGATGNGGEIVVIGNKSITLSGGSQIASAVFRATVDSSGVEKPGGKGDAGKVGVKAPDILIEGRNDRDFKSGLFASTERGAEGNGGAIFVEADRLTIRDDGLINASTSNTFNGGSIDIELTGQLTIADGGSIIADGDANIPNAGNPGNIKVSARNILFGDEGKISAITDSGANANIVLTLKQGILFNGQDSEISTDAQGPGNGGSIFIRLGTNILTDLDANNDIVATSVGGRGGRISILNGPTAKVETFRIAEKGVRRTPQSDLTASSDINQNGTIFIAADAAGLIRPSLPVLPDRPPQVTQTCKATTIANGEFFITGRGGLPTDPSDRRVSFEPLSDWSTLSSPLKQGLAYVPPGGAAKPIEATSWDGRSLGRGATIAWDWRVPCLEAIEDRGANSAH